MTKSCSIIKRSAELAERRRAKKYYLPQNIYAICGKSAIYVRYVDWEAMGKPTKRYRKHVWKSWVRAPKRDVAYIRGFLHRG